MSKNVFPRPKIDIYLKIYPIVAPFVCLVAFDALFLPAHFHRMAKKTNEIILHLGSNEGHRNAHLRQARHLLGAVLGTELAASAIYETSAWGLEAQRPFLNVALRYRADIRPEALLALTQGIEQRMGRQKAARWGSRNIDIDLLYVGRCVLDTAHLTLPHSMLAQRRFVLVPLLDVAPTWVHPVLGLDTRALLAACTDAGQVVRCC